MLNTNLKRTRTTLTAGRRMGMEEKRREEKRREDTETRGNGMKDER